MPAKQMTMGLIVGNRGFFPDHLAKSGREEMLRTLHSAGVEVVALTSEESKYGAVETREESRRRAELFKRNRERIDGIIVTLPNFGGEPNKAVCFHCSNLPKHFFRSVKMDFQQIVAGTVGKENTFGTCVGLIKPEEMSFARFSTDGTSGTMRGYVGVGRFTDDPLDTFGGAGVVEIPQMQKLLHFICEKGFEHHVAANLSTVSCSVQEATTRYLGWDMYDHGCDNGVC